MSKQLYSYLQLVQSLLAPGIAAVFMAGIFSRSVTPKSGLVGLATGFALGMLRLVLQAMHRERRHRVAVADPGVRRHQLAVFQLPAVRVHLRRDLRGEQVHAARRRPSSSPGSRTAR